MDYHTVYAGLRQRVVGGEACETCLVYGHVLSARILSVQKVNELLGRRVLGVNPLKTRFGDRGHRPFSLVDIDSHENLLSAERNFVPLHCRVYLSEY